MEKLPPVLEASGYGLLFARLCSVDMEEDTREEWGAAKVVLNFEDAHTELLIDTVRN
jgi:hypothetical protein